MRQVLLVSVRAPRVESFRRREDGRWVLEDLADDGDLYVLDEDRPIELTKVFRGLPG